MIDPDLRHTYIRLGGFIQIFYRSPCCQKYFIELSTLSCSDLVTIRVMTSR